MGDGDGQIGAERAEREGGSGVLRRKEEKVGGGKEGGRRETGREILGEEGRWRDTDEARRTL